MNATQQSAGKPNARARSATLREQQRQRERHRRLLVLLGSAGLVVLVIAAMILIYVLKGDSKNAPPATRAPAAVVTAVTHVPTSVWQQVGTGAATVLPTKINGPILVEAGKPLVLYIGAEFCPYCAGERWAVINALSRFGTWSNLGATSSASQDKYPSTPTFSFHGASFSSPYVAFEGVETTTNQALSGGGYEPLNSPTTTQAALQKQFGTDSNGNQSIPFIDFANKYRILGATYDVGTLQGSSRDEIATDLADPGKPATKGILGSANAITAAICTTTNDQPSSVCDNETITSIQAKLAVQR